MSCPEGQTHLGTGSKRGDGGTAGLPAKMCTKGRHPGAQLNQNTAHRITGSGKKGKSSIQARKLKTRGTESMVSNPSGYKDHLGGVVEVQISSFISRDPDLKDLYVDKHISDYKADRWPMEPLA